MKNQTELEAMIRERLDELKLVTARNPQVAARARARFLAQAVSANEAHRNRGWGFIFRKRQFALNMVVTILVIAGLLAGGGTTVRAAQDDLPNEPLYVIKILSEDVSLQFQNSPEAKADRLLELSQTRVQEMTQLIKAGQTPPEQVAERLEQHLQETLQLYSNLGDAELDQALVQLHEQLQQYEHDMQRLQVQATQGSQPVLERTHKMLQTQLHVVNQGLVDHQAFRNTVRNGVRDKQTQTPPTPTSTPSTSATPPQNQNDQATPQPGGQGNGDGLGPNPDPGKPKPHMTPTPKNGSNQPGSGNDKDKEKVPKDKDPKDPKDKDPGENESGGKGSGGKEK
jgi:hypothetical protein